MQAKIFTISRTTSGIFWFIAKFRFDQIVKKVWCLFDKINSYQFFFNSKFIKNLKQKELHFFSFHAVLSALNHLNFQIRPSQLFI